MTQNEFIYWLQGFIERADGELSEKQVGIIRDTLNKVDTFTYTPLVPNYTENTWYYPNNAPVIY